MAKISVIEPLGVSDDKLEEIFSNYKFNYTVEFYHDKPNSQEELINRCKNSEIIVLSQIPFNKEVIDSCKFLKYICVAFTGYDHVDVAYCKEKGITVANCSGYSTEAVGELVIGMALNILRNISKNDEAVRSLKDKTNLIGSELSSKTFGIIGYGAIGKRVAQLANCFGCKVLAYSRSYHKEENVEFTSLEDLLRRSDIVSLHVPSNSETKNMIGQKQLEMMKKSAILINCARGAVIDNQALAEALNNDVIKAAAIDVYDYEPPLKDDYCLLKAKNCYLTAHVGFASEEAFVKRAEIVAKNIDSYIKKEPLNVVNR